MMQLRKTPTSRYIAKAGKFKIYDYCFSCSKRHWNSFEVHSSLIFYNAYRYVALCTDFRILRPYYVPPLCIVEQGKYVLQKKLEV
eukprot:scaffold1656_cov76-Skeletonema_marinoi.AAC.6